MAKYIVKEQYIERVRGVRTYELEASSIEEAQNSIKGKEISDVVSTREVLASETFAIQLAQ